MAGVARRVAAVAAAGRDYYGREDADAAHLERRPASFAIFGKPGLPADSLADALSAYWGCVHVSAAAGLAAGRAGARAAWALRRGKAVTAAGTAAQLNAVLALADPVVRERGYVLTGFPRWSPTLCNRRALCSRFLSVRTVQNAVERFRRTRAVGAAVPELLRPQGLFFE